MLMAAVVMVIAVPAQAVDFKIYGQVNRAAMYTDEGSSADWFFVENDNSSTRFRFRGSNDFAKGWKVGFLWEVEMQSNASNEVSMTETDTSGITFRERKMEFWVGQKYGKVWLGQGDTASNSTSEVDLSGTTVTAYSALRAATPMELRCFCFCASWFWRFTRCDDAGF